MQMNETMGGNIGMLRDILRETSGEIISTHNLSNALVQNQRRFSEEFSIMRDAAASSIVDLQVTLQAPSFVLCRRPMFTVCFRGKRV
jgi:hypothetical protein